eukprot:1812607-Prymnesium_polylepis.1
MTKIAPGCRSVGSLSRNVFFFFCLRCVAPYQGPPSWSAYGIGREDDRGPERKCLFYRKHTPRTLQNRVKTVLPGGSA